MLLHHRVWQSLNLDIYYFTESPEMWTKQQVGNWVSDKCKEFEIDENEVSKLKSQNGKGLDRLSKEDWIRRSENHGDLFFDLWQELKQNTTEAKDKEEVGKLFNNALISCYQLHNKDAQVI